MLRNRSRLLRDLVVILISVALTVGLLLVTGRISTSSTTSGASQSVMNQIIARGSLRAGIPVAGLPVATRDASGNIVGVVPDLAAEMAKALGVKLDIVDTATANRIPDLIAGKIDFSIGTITLERAKSVSFSNPWAVDGTSAAFLKSSGITQYSDIKGKKIAAVTGATGDLVATDQFPGNDISRVDQVSTAIQAVVSGQADVVFDDYSTLSLASADNPNLVTLTPLTVEPSGIMVPLNDHQWVNWLNWFLADYYSSGVSTCGCGFASYAKWFKVTPPPLTFHY
jgi:polar amino acid transport system substrate-binding protein